MELWDISSTYLGYRSSCSGQCYFGVIHSAQASNRPITQLIAHRANKPLKFRTLELYCNIYGVPLCLKCYYPVIPCHSLFNQGYFDLQMSKLGLVTSAT